MLQLIMKWLSRSSQPRRPRAAAPRHPARPSFRPGLETLEDRLALSSAGVISAITGTNGQTGVFAIGTDTALYYSQNSGFNCISDFVSHDIPYSVRGFLQISAGLDRAGNPICFAINADHTLSVFSTSSGQAGGQNVGGFCWQISGTRNDECYVIGQSHDLWRYDGADNTYYPLVYTTEPGGFTQLSAGVDQYSNDEVYGVTAYNHVEVVHNDQSFRWLPISALQVSAGIGGNSTGIDLYYINAADRSLHWYDGTTNYAFGGVCLQICASLDSSGGRACYVIGTDHYVWWEKSWMDWQANTLQPYWAQQPSGQVDQISAAANDMVFTVQSGNDDIVYYDPNHAWSNDYGSSSGWYWWYGVAANPNAM
jgi:hypothetical protein